MDTRNRTNMKTSKKKPQSPEKVSRDVARRLAWSAYRQATFWPFNPEGEALKQKLLKAVNILTQQHD